MYTLGLFLLPGDMQRKEKAVYTKKEEEMNWNTKSKMIKLMQVERKVAVLKRV